MRDPDRIPLVLRELERIWQRHPDWRLGQLLSNLAAWAEEDVWDIEEDVLVREINTHLSNLERIERGEIDALIQGKDSER